MTGLVIDIILSMLMAVTVMLFAILVGRFIDRFDALLLTKLSNISGKNVASLILNRLMFIGVVFHELSHALFAMVSGAQVTKIRCFTLFSKDTLGYVNFVPTGSMARQGMQRCLISCAPVITAFVTVPLMIWLAMSPDASFPFKLLAVWAALSILCHASMSDADMKLYRQGAWTVFPAMTGLMFVIICLFL